jgi:hypothetical protein
LIARQKDALVSALRKAVFVVFVVFRQTRQRLAFRLSNIAREKYFLSGAAFYKHDKALFGGLL